MTADTQTPGGWPDAARPGYPQNPEQDGSHVIRHKESGDEWTAVWHCGEWIDASGDFGPSHAAIYYDYLGPCLTPAEVAAREAAARREGIEAAWHVIEARAHECAIEAAAWQRDVPEARSATLLMESRAKTLENAAAAIRALLEDGRC